jgi:ABC-type glycerol-3-phosphate transport system substrate-binding protein
MEFYRELGQTACIAEANWPLQGAYSELLDKSISQEIAMLVVGPGMYNAMRQSCPDCSAELILLPEGPAGRATVAVVRGYGITPGGLSKGDAPIRFLEFAESAEGMRFWIGEQTDPLDFIPARPELWGEWLESHPEGQAFVDSISFTRNLYLNTVTLSAIERFDRAAGDSLNNVLRNNAPAEEVLPGLQATGLQILGTQ